VPGNLSEGAQSFRTGMRAMIGLALVALSLAFAGMKGWVARKSVPSSLLLFAGATIGAGWSGIKGHRRALADRERASGQFMIVAIAAQLGRQDEETLREIAGKGGPAAEAAELILEGRRQKVRGSSAAPSIQK
jgi:hypothetical protein